MVKQKEQTTEEKETGPTDAQLHKAKVVEEEKKTREAKLAEVTRQVNKEAEAYVADLHGSWIPFKDGFGNVHPCMVVGHEFKTTDKGLKVALTVLVFSSKTAQPYRAELVY